jgi:sec-independent protein translocase protein TatB
MQLEELKKLQSEIQDSARSLESSIKSGMHSVEESVTQTTQSAQNLIQEVTAAPAEAEADSAPAAPVEPPSADVKK